MFFGLNWSKLVKKPAPAAALGRATPSLGNVESAAAPERHFAVVHAPDPALHFSQQPSWQACRKRDFLRTRLRLRFSVRRHIHHLPHPRKPPVGQVPPQCSSPSPPQKEERAGVRRPKNSELRSNHFTTGWYAVQSRQFVQLFFQFHSFIVLHNNSFSQNPSTGSGTKAVQPYKYGGM
jgi:hypothetical protein